MAEQTTTFLFHKMECFLRSFVRVKRLIWKKIFFLFVRKKVFLFLLKVSALLICHLTNTAQWKQFCFISRRDSENSFALCGCQHGQNTNKIWILFEPYFNGLFNKCISTQITIQKLTRPNNICIKLDFTNLYLLLFKWAVYLVSCGETTSNIIIFCLFVILFRTICWIISLLLNLKSNLSRKSFMLVILKMSKNLFFNFSLSFTLLTLF